METVIVHVPGQRAPVVLGPGESVTFGRGGGTRDAGIVVPGREVSRLAGEVRASDDFWLASNYSGQSTYVIRNPQGGGEFVKLPPLRLDMPVPFEFADVSLPASGNDPAFRVLAPRHAYADPGLTPGPEDERTVTAFPLDPTARYFLILVALCEPRLREASSVVIPTVPEIIGRLADAGHGNLTRAGVNFHIEYLARHKLRVKPSRDDIDSGAADRGGKADWQREALVALALRFNLVRHEHLSLLGEPGR